MCSGKVSPCTREREFLPAEEWCKRLAREFPAGHLASKHRGAGDSGLRCSSSGGVLEVARVVRQSATLPSASSDRRGVVGLLVLLFAITYLDRVCISVAGPRMQEDLGIDPIGWGWVTGMFTLAYCLFEIPTGMMGDRIGPRRVLTRIVVWWSAFTALTGVMTGFYPLLLTRFLFGAGEAGAFPNASVVVSRWFPPRQRATMSGVNLMASQVGGAIAPLLVLPIQMRYGWRMSFYVFGVAGLVWAAIWYAWFRDSPEEKRGQVAPLSTTTGASPAGHSFPWRLACRSKTVWSILGLAFCYVYVYNFFQTWFHTFLIRGRGFSEANLLLSALPYVVAACANLAGGAASDALVRRVGAKRGRRVIGATALTAAAAFTGAAMLTHHQVLTVVFLALTYGAITFQQSGVFGVCLDIGGPRAGAMVGLMNTLAQVGGLAGSVLYGYIVARTGSYDAPFIPMAVLLLLGAALWVNVDASREVGGASPAPLMDVAEAKHAAIG
jgi:MFS transporter, ACS family, glucarate transporter